MESLYLDWPSNVYSALAELGNNKWFHSPKANWSSSGQKWGEETFVYPFTQISFLTLLSYLPFYATGLSKWRSKTKVTLQGKGATKTLI